MKLSANKKKIIVLCSMVVLLIVAGTLNIVLNMNLAKKPIDGDTATTFFSAYRTDREANRAEQIAYLDSIIKSDASTKDAIAAAEKQKLELCASMEKELVLEGLIKAKGYDDAVVTMSTNNINIIVNKAEFTSDDAGSILGVVLAETDYKATQVVLVPYKS